MHHLSFDLPRFSRSTIPGLILGTIWFAGLSLGILAARFYGDPLGSLVLSAGSADLSFRDACVVTVLPLLFSACAVFFFQRFGAYLACLLRGLGIGFLLGAVSGAGGALMSLLLMFSGLCYSPVLLLFLWRRLRYGMRGFRRDIFLCLGAGLGLSAVDAFVISPFLAMALTF